MSIQHRLPVELVVECYRFLFPPLYLDPCMTADKPSWKDIEGLTLATKESRELILRLWFHALHVTSLSDWDHILRDWRRIYHWTRVVRYSGATVHQAPKAFLQPFRRLKTVRLDLPPTFSTPEGEWDFGGPEIERVLDYSVPCDVIEHLEINGVTWLDPYVMKGLAARVPNLKTLRFKQPLVWCGVCNTIDAPAFSDIPGSIVYEDGKGLPAAYARYLAPLLHLHTVQITVACSIGHLEYHDLFLTNPVDRRNPPLVSFMRAKQQPLLSQFDLPQAKNKLEYKFTGWSGECESCMTQLYQDIILRESWLKRREHDILGNPGNSTPHPPSLRRVEWELLDLTARNWPDLLPSFKDGEE